MKVKSIEIEKDEDFQKIEEVYEKIEIEFNKGSEPNQIVFAGWLRIISYSVRKMSIGWMSITL